MAFFSNKKTQNQPSRRRSAPIEPTSQPAHSFRRNQTLTGSRSSSVTSSTEFNGTMLSPRAQAHHLAHRRRKIITRLIGLGVLTLGLYVFLGQLVASNQVSVQVDGATNSTLSAAYANTIDEYLATRPSERFYPSLNRDALISAVQEKHPEVLSLVVELTGSPGKAITSVSLRKPVARWTIKGENEYVDETGHVFGVNGYEDPSVEIVDQTGLGNDGSGVITSNRFLSFVGQVVGGMSTRGHTVTKATMPLLTTRQISLDIANVAYPIKMVTDRSAGEQVEDANRVITYLVQKGISAEYIDVRVQGRAFYK